MGREEQIEEREVLDSIFPDEIQDISETEFRLSTVLDVVNENGDDTEPPTMVMTITFPPDYPDIGPEIDLSSLPSTAPHPHLDLSTDKDQLLASLSSTIEENLGMQMVFTLHSTLKEAVEELIRTRQAASREVETQRLARLEEEENRKFHGTMVNAETFATWRVQFRAEMEAAREERMLREEAEERKRLRGRVEAVGLTGRQLWERGMAGKVEESEDENEEIVPVKDIRALKV